MDFDTAATMVSVILIAIGALCLALATVLSFKIRTSVPGDIKSKWSITIAMTIFFVAGYLVADLILLLNIDFPLELITGFVFFGGAGYVLIMVNLAKHTILQIRNLDEIKALNEELNVKTNELEKANKKNKQILREVEQFTKVIDEISKGDLEAQVPKIKSDKKLNKLSDSFSRMYNSYVVSIKMLEEKNG